MTTIAQRSQAVTRLVAEAAVAAARPTQQVMLLAVSKSHPVEAIREAWHAGLHDFGENYLQEALDKQALLTDLPIVWHFIGPIQSNKTRPISESFAWVHGVDRLKIAQRLSDARPAGSPPLNICLQVNVSHEPSKSGCAPEELPVLAQAVAQLPRLQLRGLMAIPEPTTDVARQHRQFGMLRALQTQLNNQGYALDTLSMGMSEDYGVAIEEGATIVRIGTAIFGARAKKEHHES